MISIKVFWRQISIKTKFLSYFFVVILLLSLFNLYLNNNNNKIMDQFNETMINYYSINQLLELTEDNKTSLQSYLKELNPEDKDKYQRTKSAIDIQIERLYERSNSRELYFTLTAIANSTASYFDLWDSAIVERENKVDEYYIKLYEGEDIERYTEEYISDLLYQSLSEGTELYNQLSEEAELMKSISIILIFGVTIVAMLIGVLFSNTLVRPIKKLAKASLRISSGDLEVEPIDTVSEDEVGVLTKSFNIMSKSIKEYVNDLEQKVIIEKKLHEEELEVVRMEHLVNEAQFKALQSQINPHFLFNTLNTISRTAMFEEADNTMKLIQSLSSLFRYKLRNDSDLIRIDEEVDISNEYIYLQQMRFKERLNFEIHVDEDSKKVLIPIFSLQPIVENAIIHGIEPKVEGGTVRIKIITKIYNDYKETRIRITDTGVGIDQDRLRKVRDFELNNNSIGVGNVYHRLMLTYGEETVFRILSKPGLGTMVEFKFREGGGSDEK